MGKPIWIELIGPWAAGKSTFSKHVKEYLAQDNTVISEPGVFYQLARRDKFVILLRLLITKPIKSGLVFALLLKSYFGAHSNDPFSIERRAMVRSFATHYIARAYIVNKHPDVVVWEGEYHHIPAIRLNTFETRLMCILLAESTKTKITFVHLTEVTDVLISRIIDDARNKGVSRFSSLSPCQVSEYLSEYLRNDKAMLSCISSLSKQVIFRPQSTCLEKD